MDLLISNTTAMPPGLCAIQQHPYYGDALRAVGARVSCVSVHHHGLRIAQAQMVHRRFGLAPLTWIPRGPVWAKSTSATVKSRILETLHHEEETNSSCLTTLECATDLSVFRAARYRALLSPHYVAELCLRRETADRLSAQSVKWRNRLRRAERSGIAVGHRPFRPGFDDWLLAAEMTQRRTRSYRALPTSFTTGWARAHPHATRLFMAHKDNRIIAAMLFLRHPPTATYHIGWNGPDGRKYSAHNLLLWRASIWLAQQGCLRLDLGQIDTQNNPGLARFKLGSGAHLRALGPTMLRLPGRARRRIAA